MSKKFEEQKQISAFDVVISALAILVCLPILPLNLLYIFLILKTNKKENFVLFPCIALLVILCAKMGVFLQETIQIALALVKGLFNHSLYDKYAEFEQKSEIAEPLKYFKKILVEYLNEQITV